jgi:putative transposase
MKKRFSEEQIVGVLREAAAGGKTIGEVCRRHAVSEPTFYAWRRRYEGMAESEVRRLRDLEKENGRLKRLLAERDVELDVMKELLGKR